MVSIETRVIKLVNKNIKAAPYIITWAIKGGLLLNRLLEFFIFIVVKLLMLPNDHCLYFTPPRRTPIRP